jgi:hypothetical protein
MEKTSSTGNKMWYNFIDYIIRELGKRGTGVPCICRINRRLFGTIYNEMPSFEVLSIRHVKMKTDRETSLGAGWSECCGVVIPANDDAISPSFKAYRLWTVSSYVC